jgi:predicted DNA-binding protein (MmcQ/YjbR family)
MPPLNSQNPNQAPNPQYDFIMNSGAPAPKQKTGFSAPKLPKLALIIIGALVLIVILIVATSIISSAEKSNPVRISLKCDPTLSENLRAKYESVMPGYHLNKKHWNTIVLSGQLSDQEVKDLILHSYSLVAG